MTIGLFLAVAGLIQFGEIESISQLGALATDPSVRAFVIVSASIAVGVNVSTFLLFGLLAPDDLQSEVSTLRNPVTYISSAAVFALIFITGFVAITFLNGLSQWLGIALAALVIAYRYNSSCFWRVLGGTRTQIVWTNRVVILLPIVAAAIVYVTGSLPSWTIGEWAVGGYYVLVVILSFIGPVDAIFGMIGEQINTVATAIIYVQVLEDRREELTENSPDDCEIEFQVDVPSSMPDSLREAQWTVNACECVEQRFEAYETYVKAYRELDETLNDSISERAGTGDRTTLGSVVAGFARNMHPKYYDDAKEAQRAATVLASVVESYNTGYASDVDDLGPEGEIESLIDVLAPTDTSLDQIDALFETAPGA
ncbi:hypothetical protein G3I44_16310 [Halogeometricum borinquense]|uniref:Uncharacterized protein n=2 Tax=Halogeometricum borinquense TaxID=60847 RepID=A0A6C0UQ73_9EURY|nr:hypothetical protein G3I44_16310 [Halogeometricum borinquense]